MHLAETHPETCSIWDEFYFKIYSNQTYNLAKIFSRSILFRNNWKYCYQLISGKNYFICVFYICVGSIPSVNFACLYMKMSD